jgi:hypothetical protein
MEDDLGALFSWGIPYHGPALETEDHGSCHDSVQGHTEEEKAVKYNFSTNPSVSPVIQSPRYLSARSTDIIPINSNTNISYLLIINNMY